MAPITPSTGTTTARPFQAKLKASFKRMAKGVKTYGKKKGNDLVASFQNLNLKLSPGTKGAKVDDDDDDDREPLLERSSNQQNVNRLDATGQSAAAAAKGKGKGKGKKSGRTDPAKPSSSLATKEVRDAPSPSPNVSTNSGRSTAGQAITNVPAQDYLKPLTGIDGVKSTVEDFQAWHDQWNEKCNITKIAQGSYGSVFKLENRNDRNQSTIGKIMPLRGKTGRGSSKVDLTSIQYAANEAQMLITMSDYHGFVEFRTAQILRGRLPPPLITQYRDHDAKRRAQGDSEHQDTFVEFSRQQIWLFLEMTNAGTELEELLGKQDADHPFTIRKAWDVFWDTARALEIGEVKFNFEHRDLHNQNICINDVTESSNNPDDDSVDNRGIPKYGDSVATIIDYTLSRATLDSGRVISNAMADRTLFQGEGAVQYDIYRHMQQMVEGKSSQRGDHSKEWEGYQPKTNLLWLYHLLETIIGNIDTNQADSDQHTEDLHEASVDDVLWCSLNNLKNKLRPEIMDECQYSSASEVVEAQGQAKETFMARITEVEEGKRRRWSRNEKDLCPQTSGQSEGSSSD